MLVILKKFSREMSQALHFGSDSVQRYKKWNEMKLNVHISQVLFQNCYQAGTDKSTFKVFFAWACKFTKLIIEKKRWNMGLPFTTIWNSNLQDLKKSVKQCVLVVYGGLRLAQRKSRFQLSLQPLLWTSLAGPCLHDYYKRQTYFWFKVNLFFSVF